MLNCTKLVYIIPIISYFAHVWAWNSSALATKLQNKALRFFFGLGKAAPLAALIGDSGWIPINADLQFVLLKYWFRVCSISAQ